MTHLWVRAEQRTNEERVGLTPDGARALIAEGMTVTVEESRQRAIPIDGYRDAGCTIAPEGSWPEAPDDAIIFGLKELPEDGTPLRHRHIMFGHAFKGQHSGRALLERFKAGGGTLYDLEYLVDGQGRRVAAFGYWAGYAGAAVTVKSWAAQRRGGICPAVGTYSGKDALLADLERDLEGLRAPSAIIIGALGRVGTGAADLCDALGLAPTRWDMNETSKGGPFPEILAHDMFLNCIFARPGTPVFVPASALDAPRDLTVIGDVACDPDSDYNPVPIYDEATDWAAPARRVHDAPPMDVMAIDNLPSLLPVEASQDFSALLLPSLRGLGHLDCGVWGRAHETFTDAMKGL
ncbi:saccharopine dehydrogenase [Roseovarius nanhaiticus]|uniref:Saccharopine dehydrogenase [NAD(+), L-lysine-forming] n=1 Tax=Roseovarius nanhaiticus TaxID=573024 RepID=A0A1N7EGM8_9RHOB|nr:saccharopine dehydrogenase [Roseovarius nanhaiticus]SEK75233.1 saccharopine dehydrogenase (NAD+, L-lysine forming) [Roseovarius nanhaiticus]SIR87075.1 saccharopine dehydrogenase (NAD+, L-lysine forming) [Roseovarius nanhaiticus]